MWKCLLRSEIAMADEGGQDVPKLDELVKEFTTSMRSHCNEALELSGQAHLTKREETIVEVCAMGVGLYIFRIFKMLGYNIDISAIDNSDEGK
jgi:hypothetical protein